MKKQLFDFNFEGNSFQEIFELPHDVVAGIAEKWTLVMRNVVDSHKDYTFEAKDGDKDRLGIKIGKIFEDFLTTATNDRERLFVIMSFTRLEQMIIRKLEYKITMNEFADVVNNLGK